MLAVAVRAVQVDSYADPGLRMSKLAPVLVLIAMPVFAGAQAPAAGDSVSLIVAVEGWKQAAPGDPPRGSGQPSTGPLAGVIVALKGGPELGITDEAGRVTVRFARADRVDLQFRAKDQKNLGCRVRVTAAVDSLSVVMMGENRVAVWSKFGCKPIR